MGRDLCQEVSSVFYILLATQKDGDDSGLSAGQGLTAVAEVGVVFLPSFVFLRGSRAVFIVYVPSLARGEFGCSRPGLGPWACYKFISVYRGLMTANMRKKLIFFFKKQNRFYSSS